MRKFVRLESNMIGMEMATLTRQFSWRIRYKLTSIAIGRITGDLLCHRPCLLRPRCCPLHNKTSRMVFEDEKLVKGAGASGSNVHVNVHWLWLINET
jgi:hypothetical protein